MKNELDELYKLIVLNSKKSPFAKTRTLNSWHSELEGEVKELGIALKNNDLQNMREEIGDCLWDVLSFLSCADEKGYLDVKKIIKEQIRKINRRKPWLLKGKIPKTVKEENDLWNRIKNIEKKKIKNAKKKK